MFFLIFLLGTRLQPWGEPLTPPRLHIEYPEGFMIKDLRICIKCSLEKPITSFCDKGNGRRAWTCYSCEEKRKKENNPDKFALNRLIRNRRYTQRNPEKVKAHYRVKDAVLSGLLKKHPCEKCGEKKANAHHDDYSKPLQVRWLCSLHHREHHYGTGDFK